MKVENVICDACIIENNWAKELEEKFSKVTSSEDRHRISIKFWKSRYVHCIYLESVNIRLCKIHLEKALKEFTNA